MSARTIVENRDFFSHPCRCFIDAADQDNPVLRREIKSRNSDIADKPFKRSAKVPFDMLGMVSY